MYPVPHCFWVPVGLMCGRGVFNPQGPQVQAPGVESSDLICRLGHRMSVTAEQMVAVRVSVGASYFGGPIILRRRPRPRNCDGYGMDCEVLFANACQERTST